MPPYNRIIYGAPGTGKSYLLKEEIENYSKVSYWGVVKNINSKINYIEDGIWVFESENESREDVKKTIETIKNEIKVGDVVFLKSQKKTGNQALEIFAIGVVLEKRDEYKALKVDWRRKLNIEKKEYLTIEERNEGIIKKITNENDLKMLLKDWEKYIINKERVIFYDGYTYGQFVGTYKPSPKINNEKTETITYKYIPGPFLKNLVKAYKYPQSKVYLVIEEINRAKADRVFGNIFQLLDRDKEGNSQYFIGISEDQEKYLKEELGQELFEEKLSEGLYIPSNFYIWATMNCADQGVYQLDSAFRRRWIPEYIGIDDNEDKVNCENLVEYRKSKSRENYFVHWNDFRKVINEKLLSNKVLEDSLLAPFFVNDDCFEKNEEGKKVLRENVFIDKVIMYLFDEVLKYKEKNILFRDNIKNFSDLKKIFKENKENEQKFSIFNEEIVRLLEEKMKSKS